MTGPPGFEPAADGGIVAELQSRHGHSAQPESQQVLAVLQAVLEVIGAQGMPATPTSIFAALMSALERPDAQQSAVTALAMCSVLSTTLGRVPNGVLRAKFVGSVQLLSGVAQQHREQAAVCKAALQCLGQVLAAAAAAAPAAAADAASGPWPPAATQGFQLLLSFSTDARPKLRKRAHASAADVLGALQESPGALGVASDAVLALCRAVLSGPAAAQRAAAAASHKQRAAAEAAIVAAVADLLHVLGALKGWAPLLAGPSLPSLIDMLMKLYGLQQPLVSRHTSEVLTCLVTAHSSGGSASSGGHLSSGQLAQLLGLLIDGAAGRILSGAGTSSQASAAAAAAAGGDQVTAMARLLEGGLMKLVGSSSSSSSGGAATAAAAAAAMAASVAHAARLLPRVVHLLVPLLAAEQDGVRYSASGALQSLVSRCLTPRVLAAMQQQQQQQQPAAAGGGSGGLAPLTSLVAAVSASLGARYQEAWALTLPVAASLFEALAAARGGSAAAVAAAAAPLLAALGQICAGLSDAAEEREAAAMAAMEQDGPEVGAAAAAAAAAAGSSAYAAAAEAALGAAIRHLGPEVVLGALPLNLRQGLDGSGEARTWLLPALRRHVAGAPLRYWAGHLLPLSREMAEASAAASSRGNKSLAAACHALELQLWSVLGAFANWPADTADVYAELAPALASAFHTREDLRPTISSVLVKLCRQARGVALAALAPPAAADALPLHALRLQQHNHRGAAAAAATAAEEGVSAETRRAIAALQLVSAAAAAVHGSDAAAHGGGGDDDDDGNAQHDNAADGGSDDDEFAEYGSSGGNGSSRNGSRRRQQQRSRGQLQAGGDHDGNAPGNAPPAFSAAVALSQLLALRGFSVHWMKLLCKVFVDSEVESRGPVGEALAAYAAISDASVAAELYTITLKKYQQAGAQAAASDGAPLLLEGGSTPDERQAAFIELALCLAAGLPDAALDPLFVVCQAHVLGGSSLLQKRAYRVLAYLAGSRTSWLLAHEGGPQQQQQQQRQQQAVQQQGRGGQQQQLQQQQAQQHLAALLELLLLGAPLALSPAKRYRLRCLQPLILLLDATPCPPLPALVDAASGAEKVPGGAALAAGSSGSSGGGGSSAAAAEARRLLLAQTLVGEVVLATKEVNKKTRAAAYQLLVDIAHELDDARPMTVTRGHTTVTRMSDSKRGDRHDRTRDDSDSDSDGDAGGGSGGGDSSGDAMDEGGRGGGGDDDGTPEQQQQQQLSGGLLDFVNAVMAGLVGASPHMQSASVLALARLVFEFAGALEGLVGRLLPAVLLLLRSSSREVVKAVLGFIKVCAMRMPVELLLAWLPQIMEGMLLWADDSKNKFRLKVRVILERLVRRCGVEHVAAACPPGDAKLMAHIRKQQSRRERRRGAAAAAGSEGGSQADEAEFDVRSRGRSSAAGRTARASEWGHTAIFSDEGGAQQQQQQLLDARTLSGRSATTVGGGRRQQQQQQQQRGRRGGAGGGVRLAGDAADPLNLLEPSTARQLVKAASGNAAGVGGAGSGAAAAAAFPRGDDGRMIIKEDAAAAAAGAAAAGRKRKRGRGGDEGGFGSDDDSDMDDMRGFAGLEAAIRSVAHAKSVRFAPSIAASLGNRSTGGRSAGGRSAGGRSAAASQQQQGKRGGSGSGGKQHSGERYRAAGAAGDVKGRSAVEPYAYWQFDKKMLNRRRGKQAAAAKGLGGVVAGAQAGALKGAKAKRAAQQAAAKRQRR